MIWLKEALRTIAEAALGLRTNASAFTMEAHTYGVKDEIIETEARSKFL